MSQSQLKIGAWLLLALCLACSACGRAGGNAQLAAASQAAPAAASAASSNAPAAPPEVSLVSLSMGAYPMRRPDEYSGGYSVLQLMDETSDTHWSTPTGDVKPQTIVIALPERTLLKTLIFDCGQLSPAFTGACAKDVTVEMSDTSPTAGYVDIGDVSLQELVDNQRFPVSRDAPGRWVRLTVKNNHGSTAMIQLNDFRALGSQLTQTPQPDVSGTYTSSVGDMRVRQEGTAVTGCYYTRAGVFDGGLDNRAAKLSWCEDCGRADQTKGRAVWAFSPAGDSFVGLYWNAGQTGAAEGSFEGQRTSKTVGSCPQWSNASSGIEAQVAGDLSSTGTALLYGVNFDTDSDQIKAESKPLLDHVANVLKAHPDWRISVNGHTDSTSTPEHNLALSERRAASVKAYLVAAGVDASRLSTRGFGQTMPIADNATELGRSQNRRVELVKQ